MIQTPTLFVLGAGASQPYGFPLGKQLRRMICDEANQPGFPMVNLILQQGKYDFNDLQEFTNDFRYSGLSIDEYLSRHKDAVPLGKILIASFICYKENLDNLFSEVNEDHWYGHLWQKLVFGTSSDALDLRRNRVSFITFNYDRSLEFFLHRSVKSAYHVDDDLACEACSRFEIHHVYGSVGQIDFSASANDNRPYGHLIVPDKLEAASAGINIIPEGRDDSQAFKTARILFDNAQCVYFLGFGYDPTNCLRLNFSSVLRDKRRSTSTFPTVHASVLELTPVEQSRAKISLFGEENYPNFVTHNQTNLNTLRHAGLPD